MRVLRLGFRPVIVVDTFSGNKLTKFLAEIHSLEKGEQPPCAVTKPAETLPRALEVPIGHSSRRLASASLPRQAGKLRWPGTDYGQLQVAGIVTLNGVINVGLTKGNCPAIKRCSTFTPIRFRIGKHARFCAKGENRL